MGTDTIEIIGTIIGAVITGASGIGIAWIKSNAKLNKTIQNLDSRIQIIETALFGNGREGLFKQMKTAQTDIENIKIEMAKKLK